MKTSTHLFPRGRSLVLVESVALLVSLLGATQADFSDQGRGDVNAVNEIRLINYLISHQ